MQPDSSSANGHESEQARERNAIPLTFVAFFHSLGETDSTGSEIAGYMASHKGPGGR
jgi:hypothetical protein